MPGSATTCRSCHRPIFWALTTKGKRMPLDAEPIGSGLTISSGGEGDPVVASTKIWQTHFATCPESKDWSGKARGDADAPAEVPS